MYTVERYWSAVINMCIRIYGEHTHFLTDLIQWQVMIYWEIVVLFSFP